MQKQDSVASEEDETKLNAKELKEPTNVTDDPKTMMIGDIKPSMIEREEKCTQGYKLNSQTFVKVTKQIKNSLVEPCRKGLEMCESNNEACGKYFAEFEEVVDEQ